MPRISPKPDGKRPKESRSGENRREGDGTSQGEDLSARLDKLKTKLDGHTEAKARWAKDPKNPDNRRGRDGIAQAFKLSSEFIAGVVVGAAIGYGFDKFFDTSPWGMIVFLLLGFGAAVLNVMRAAGMIAESEMRLVPAHELQKRQDDADSSEEDEK